MRKQIKTGLPLLGEYNLYLVRLRFSNWLFTIYKWLYPNIFVLLWFLGFLITSDLLFLMWIIYSKYKLRNLVRTMKGFISIWIMNAILYFFVILFCHHDFVIY